MLKMTWTVPEIATYPLDDLAHLTSYRASGNVSDSPMQNTKRDEDSRLSVAAQIQALANDLLMHKQAVAIASMTPYSYVYNPATMPVATYLPWSVLGVLVHPTSAAQIVVFKNTQMLIANDGWRFGSSGIMFDEPLTVTGDVPDYILVWVFSESMSGNRREYLYSSAYGTGDGSKLFALSGLGEDLNHNTISFYPASQTAISVIKNGQVLINGYGYNFSGAGSTSQVTLTSDLIPDAITNGVTVKGDRIVFIIWGTN